MRGSNKLSFLARALPFPVFYCLQMADMEGFRKVFNALENPEEDVSVDLTATMNMSEDAMKHYGSMLALV